MIALSNPDARQRRVPKTLVYAGVIVAAILAAYFSSLRAPFELDDFRNIHENATIRQLVLDRSVKNVYARRPVGRWSLWLSYRLSGFDPAGYRALNIAVHCLAALVLFGLARRSFRLPRLEARFGPQADELALAIALLWALHPLQTQSVTYIIQRLESQMGLFFLLMLYCLVRGQTARRPWMWNVLAIGASWLSLGSKEVGAVAPLVAVLFDWTLVADSWRTMFRRRWLLYAGCLAGWIWMASVMVSPAAGGDISGGISRWEYFRSQAAVVLHYLRLAAWPDALVLDYGWPIATSWWDVALPGLLLTVALLAGLAGVWKRNALGLLVVAFFIILAPTSSFVPIDDLAFEHRMYLPLVPLVIGAVLAGQWLINWLLADARVRNQAAIAALLLIGSALGVRTYGRNQDWNDPVRLWTKNVLARPGHARAWANLAKVQLEAGLAQPAVASACHACELKPDDPWQRYILGLTLERIGEASAAQIEYEAAIAHKPRFREPLLALAKLAHAQQRWDEARKGYALVLSIDPHSAEAHDGLARLLSARGDDAAARRHFDRAVTLNPHEAQFRVNYGALLARRGDYAAALVQYDHAVRLDPRMATAWLQRAMAQFDSGDHDGARRSLQEVLRLQPQSRAARELLSRVGRP